MGAKYTRIVLLRDGVFMACRQLPIGGDQFTEAIAKAQGISFIDAEASKRQRAGIADYIKQAAQELNDSAEMFDTPASIAQLSPDQSRDLELDTISPAASDEFEEISLELPEQADESSERVGRGERDEEPEIDVLNLAVQATAQSSLDDGQQLSISDQGNVSLENDADDQLLLVDEDIIPPQLTPSASSNQPLIDDDLFGSTETGELDLEELDAAADGLTLDESKSEAASSADVFAAKVSTPDVQQRVDELELESLS